MSDPGSADRACPARTMQQRIEAMITAVGTVQPALQKFYDLLNDEQKARLNALGQDQRKRRKPRQTPTARPPKTAERRPA